MKHVLVLDPLGGMKVVDIPESANEVEDAEGRRYARVRLRANGVTVTVFVADSDRLNMEQAVVERVFDWALDLERRNT